METVNLLAAFDAATEHWSPKVVGRVNDRYVKLAKLLGQFVWHKHDEDESFQVIRGRLSIQVEDGPLRGGRARRVLRGAQRRNA